MKRASAKLSRQSGFTLAEMLVAVLILLLLTLLVAGGIPAAQRAYVGVVDAGNAEVLASTTLTVIQDGLSTASEVKVSGTNVTAFRGGSGFWTTFENSADGILIVEYTGVPGDEGVSSRERLIVSRKAATEHLHTTFDSITYTNGVFAVNGLSVVKDGEAMTTIDVFKIRAVNGAVRS